MVEYAMRDMAPCPFEDDNTFSLEHIRQEYPSYGTGDMRYPACSITWGQKWNAERGRESAYINTLILYAECS